MPLFTNRCHVSDLKKMAPRRRPILGEMISFSTNCVIYPEYKSPCGSGRPSDMLLYANTFKMDSRSEISSSKYTQIDQNHVPYPMGLILDPPHQITTIEEQITTRGKLHFARGCNSVYSKAPYNRNGSNYAYVVSFPRKQKTLRKLGGRAVCF